VGGATLIWDLLRARWGALWALRCLGLAALASSTRLDAVLAAPWLLLRSLQGHAGAHGTVPALIDWLHLTAAAVWIGSLVQLILLPRPLPPVVAERIRIVATVALAVLLPAGVYGAVLHVQRLDTLIRSSYGLALLVKLALAAVLVALGAANHFGHVPAMRRGESAASARLVRAVRVELVVATVVLLVTALLGTLPMPHEHPH
jgi:putative copper export protein